MRNSLQLNWKILMLKHGPISNTLLHRQAHPHTKSSPHVESYFNCFVSVVPSEWERSWRLQFTRHICRCCISNRETQAVRKNTYTNRHTNREIYRQIVSSSLSRARTHTRQVQRCSLLCFMAQSLRTQAHESEKKLVLSLYQKRILSYVWEKQRYITRQRCNTWSTEHQNGKKECAYQWSLPEP